MKDISQVTFCVVDNGLFAPVAHRLAKDAKRVLYYTNAERGFPKLSDYIVGDGFSDIERCDDIWEVKNEVSCFVFPDIQHSGLQLELESQGFPVWGSRAADSLEIDREHFLDVLGEIGLKVPDHDIIKGLTNLRLFLHDKEDKFIKISRYRGDMETFHWRDEDQDSGRLDNLAVKWGPAQDQIPFLVFDPIDAPIEVGGDTYCVDGQWPSLMLHGDESKDKCYLGAVTKREDIPDDLKAIYDAFGTVFKEHRYRNKFSIETRDGYFIDPTCRGGLPSTGSQLNTWKNFSEIVWHGAHGELVEPIPEHQFSAECILTLKAQKDSWGKTRVDEELKDFVKLTGCCEIDGSICFPPGEEEEKTVGWLVAGGDTMEEAIDQIHELADQLPDGLSAATDELVGLLKSIHDGEKEGVEFSDQQVPEPESAIVVD